MITGKIEGNRSVVHVSSVVEENNAFFFAEERF